MARKEHASETPATSFLRHTNISFTEQLYDYEHLVIKTLVMQDQDAQPLLVLMHSDRKVSLKNLARQISAKSVQPCTPETAERHTGYAVGETSPFGTRKNLRVFVERSILWPPKICIDGGRRGFFVEIDPQVLTTLLHARPVDCSLVE
jgi:Cys-tRNA(Pro) deacylase